MNEFDRWAKEFEQVSDLYSDLVDKSEKIEKVTMSATSDPMGSATRGSAKTEENMTAEQIVEVLEASNKANGSGTKLGEDLHKKTVATVLKVLRDAGCSSQEPEIKLTFVHYFASKGCSGKTSWASMTQFPISIGGCSVPVLRVVQAATSQGQTLRQFLSQYLTKTALTILQKAPHMLNPALAERRARNGGASLLDVLDFVDISELDMVSAVQKSGVKSLVISGDTALRSALEEGQREVAVDHARHGRVSHGASTPARGPGGDFV